MLGGIGGGVGRDGGGALRCGEGGIEWVYRERGGGRRSERIETCVVVYYIDAKEKNQGNQASKILNGSDLHSFVLFSLFLVLLLLLLLRCCSWDDSVFVFFPILFRLRIDFPFSATSTCTLFSASFSSR